jgi:rubredoxin
MPWRCPACSIPIRHSEVEDRPRIGQRYRCHVCRLELVFDPHTNKLRVAPLRDEEDEKTR